MSKLEVVLLKAELNVRYRTLSEIREQFPRNSKYRACEYIEKEMAKVLAEIEKINEHVRNNP